MAYLSVESDACLDARLKALEPSKPFIYTQLLNLYETQDIVDNPENENNDAPAPVEHMATNDDRTNVTFSMEIASPTEIAQERDRVNRLREEICHEYTLNNKQKKAYEIATENVIKRHFEDETEQLKGYVGGPGGTGKSQLIKAIVAFHKRMKVKQTLKTERKGHPKFNCLRAK